MSDFGWTRLAYLTVILAVLAILVKFGTLGASSIPQNFPESVFAFNRDEVPAEQQYREEDDHEEGDHAEHGEEHHEDHEHADHDNSREEVESLYENVNFEEEAPVFYRPSPQVGSASRSPSGAKSCQTVGDAPPGAEIVFPVTRDHFDSYEDTWGAARPQGGHEGADLMVPNGTPLLAMTDARVVPVSGANANGWNTLGGYTAMLEAAYSVGPVKEGDLFYYAHMDRKSELRIGDTVEAGDVVGHAGDTGQGPEGARGQFPPHLHLGWYETSGERTQLASGAMNPFPLLEWVKANGGAIEGGSDIPYCEAPQSSAPIPSGGGYWQFPADPGVRPDIATGTGSAVPSPVVEPGDSSESSPNITREPRKPNNPPRPANPAPPEANEPEEPESPAPPAVGVPPAFPNFPIPGIGQGIQDIIDSIIRPRPPNPPDETTAPPPPVEETTPENTTPEETTPEETTDEETTPEETTPEETESTTPDDEAAGEEDAECESHEHADEESGEEPHEHADDEECAEETDSDEDSPPEETTETTSSKAVEEQYEEDEEPEPNSGS